MDTAIQFVYVLSAALFVYGLKQLGSPATARRGNLVSSLGMLCAVVAALLDQGIVEYQWILAGFVVGGLLGAGCGAPGANDRHAGNGRPVQWLRRYGQPVGGWAALEGAASTFSLITIVLSIFIGGLTFTGSLVAYGKLSEMIGSARFCSEASKSSTACW